MRLPACATASAIWSPSSPAGGEVRRLPHRCVIHMQVAADGAHYHPDEDVALLIYREALGVDEFGFEILEVSVIEAKLPLQSPIRHALTLAQEGNHLIEDRVKVHPAPSCPYRGDHGPTTAPPHARGDVLYVSHIAGKGKQEVRERVTHKDTVVLTAQLLDTYVGASKTLYSSHIQAYHGSHPGSPERPPLAHGRGRGIAFALVAQEAAACNAPELLQMPKVGMGIRGRYLL
jgi:hypothetical protein